MGEWEVVSVEVGRCGGMEGESKDSELVCS